MSQKTTTGGVNTGAFNDGTANLQHTFLRRLPINERWKIVKRIGGGSQGTVFLARDLELSGRFVAVKMLAPVASCKRFVREAELLARVDDPHVVRILGAGCCQLWGRYLVTEFVKGGTLKDLIAAADRHNRPLPLSAVFSILLTAARGLMVLHAKRIVHRDIKPGNIGVTKSARPTAKLLDLGVSKWLGSNEHLTVKGAIIGTPRYMPPEGIAGHRATAELDIYGLGVSAWEALAGHHPLAGRFAATTIPQVCIPRPDVPLALSALIAEMMSPTPHRRPQAANVAIRLEQIGGQIS